MNKTNVLVINIIFLIMISFVVVSDEPKSYSEMSRGEQEEYLIKLFGEGVTPDDVEIVGNIAFIKNGNAVLTSETSLPVVLNGEEALVDVQQYSGTIDIGKKGGVIQGKNDLLAFNGEATVVVKDGVVVQLENANLDEGSRIGDTFIHGEDISYDVETGKIISKNVVVDDIIFSSDEEFSYNIQTKTVEGKVYVLNNRNYGNFLFDYSLIEGKAIINSNSVILLADKENPSKISELRATREVIGTIKVTADTCVGIIGCENKEISRVFIDIAWRIYAKGDNNIEIKSTLDRQFYVAEINDNSKVDLFITKRNSDKGVRFIFSNNKPIVQGNLEGVSVKVEHVFNGFPWRFFDGDDYEGSKESGMNSVAITNYVRDEWYEMIKEDLPEIRSVAAMTGIPGEAILSAIIVEDIRKFSPDFSSSFSLSYLKAKIRSVVPNSILQATGHNPNPPEGESSYGVIWRSTREGALSYLRSLDNLDEGTREILSKEKPTKVETVALALKAHTEYWERSGYDIFSADFETISSFGERVGVLETLNNIFAYYPEGFITDEEMVSPGFYHAAVAEGRVFGGFKSEIPHSAPRIGGSGLWGWTDYGTVSKVFVESGLATEILHRNE